MEILDIVDGYGNPTGKTIEREKAHEEGIMHRTSHVWLVRKNREKSRCCFKKGQRTRNHSRAVTMFQVLATYLQEWILSNPPVRPANQMDSRGWTQFQC